MSVNLEHQAAWEASTPALFYRQLIETIPPLPPSTTLRNKTAIITGANNGLGYECAKQMLFLGLSHLIIAVRSQAKGDAARTELHKEFPEARIEVSLVDMADYRSITGFAKRCEKLSRLDFAVLNAGVQRPAFERAETGHEMVFQVNYISTILLALLLIQLLKSKKSASPGHLSMVGSDTAHWAGWKTPLCTSIFEIADDAAEWAEQETYFKSKLFMLMGMQKLSEMVSPEDVVLNVCNPGWCVGTQLGAENKQTLGWRIANLLKYFIGRRREVGAREYVWAVVAGPETHGSFLSEGKMKP